MFVGAWDQEVKLEEGVVLVVVVVVVVVQDLQEAPRLAVPPDYPFVLEGDLE